MTTISCETSMEALTQLLMQPQSLLLSPPQSNSLQTGKIYRGFSSSFHGRLVINPWLHPVSLLSDAIPLSFRSSSKIKDQFRYSSSSYESSLPSDRTTTDTQLFPHAGTVASPTVLEASNHKYWRMEGIVVFAETIFNIGSTNFDGIVIAHSIFQFARDSRSGNIKWERTNNPKWW